MKKLKPWTDIDLDLLRKYFPKCATKDVSLYTGHPEGSVKRKAYSLGLHKESRCIKWHPDMLHLLREHYADTPNAKLAGWLGVGVVTVTEKATELGLVKRGRLYKGRNRTPDGKAKYISPEEDAFIRANIDTMSRRKIARALGYAPCTVTQYCRKHQIAPRREEY